MKSLTTLLGIIAPATAFAASESIEDNSGILVWTFLGFCALIVVAQVLPAVLSLLGITKGAASVVKEELAPAKAKK
jgi:hypothetical protein